MTRPQQYPGDRGTAEGSTSRDGASRACPAGAGGGEAPPDVRLVPMTPRMYHRYFREYENDPDLYIDRTAFSPYTYSEEKTERYIRRQRDLDRVTLAVLHGDEIVGEIVLKNIEERRSATIGLCMKNDRCKNRGYGTQAERLAIAYVFEELDIPVLYADALVTNTRSRHVLEKVGFRFVREEGDFAFYRIDREAWRRRRDGTRTSGR